MSETRVFILRVDTNQAEILSTRLWESFASVLLGIEEAPNNMDSLFKVAPQFEILEFRSEAAKKCAQWLQGENFKGQSELLLKLYFPTSAQITVQKITELCPEAQVIAEEDLKSVDYLAEYRKRVKGICVGEHLWVGPPWDHPPKDGVQRHSFIVDPGLAFGTGDHPTTQLCLLRLLELSQESKAPARILDLGTGSGILAAASRQFFPQSFICATDLDPVCAEQVAKTFALNHLPKAKLDIRVGNDGAAATLQKQGLKFDLLISNIYAEVLAALVPSLHGLCESDGLWIASGIVEGPPEQKLLEAAKPYFRLVARQTLLRSHSQWDLSQGLKEIPETWVRLDFVPNPPSNFK